MSNAELQTSVLYIFLVNRIVLLTTLQSIKNRNNVLPLMAYERLSLLFKYSYKVDYNLN